jgi:NDP-sugar pyrophosphorylase family protein
MKPTLVVLAAGIGTRYGGMKQLEAIGPGGATLMDYAVFDALRAGFGRIVFVIRPDMEEAVRATLGKRYEPRVRVAYAFQRLEDLPPGFDVPPGRTKPWGTGHAVLCAAGQVQEPFAVANADDFYGANSFAALGEFLRQSESAAPAIPTYAVVGYSLRDTLSEAGPVNRGVCRCTPDGWLEQIVETLRIEKYGADAKYTDESGTPQVRDGDTPVSMNLWGFTPALFDQLRDGFRRFLEEQRGSTKAELYLPAVIQDAIAAGQARVRVLPTADRWCGMTNPEDKQVATRMIYRLVAEGVYPERLWD